MDLSQLSDEDLKRLADNDYSKLSDQAKEMFKATPEPVTATSAPASTMPQPIPAQTGPVAPDLSTLAGNAAGAVVDYGIAPAVGAAQTAANMAAAHPALAGAAGYAAASKIAPGLTGWGAAKNIANAGINQWQTNNLTKLGEQIRIGKRFGQDMSALENIFNQQTQAQAQKMAAQQTAQQTAASQPSMMQRGMDMASKMRNVAAQRVVGTAVVPGAVAAGGYKAAQTATNQMAAMTPEQRRAFYDNQMLGAMSGDAGLAAAIMNRGQ